MQQAFILILQGRKDSEGQKDSYLKKRLRTEVVAKATAVSDRYQGANALGSLLTLEPELVARAILTIKRVEYRDTHRRFTTQHRLNRMISVDRKHQRRESAGIRRDKRSEFTGTIRTSTIIRKDSTITIKTWNINLKFIIILFHNIIIFDYNTKIVIMIKIPNHYDYLTKDLTIIKDSNSYLYLYD